MSKTMADHARAYRQRKAARIARYEAALRQVVSDCELAFDALGNSSQQFDSVRTSFQIIAARARQALGDAA